MGSARKPSAINAETGKRLYVSEIPFEEQMNMLTQKYLDGVKLIKQSEFKKPYQADSYEEMEHFADVGLPPWKFTPPNPDEGFIPDCKVQVEAAGAQDRGWSGCDPYDNCGLWIFTCAHRLTKIGCGNCKIKKITKLEGDRLAVIICSDNDKLDISLISDYDPKGSTVKERFCTGEGHNPNCNSCEECTQAAYPPVINYITQQMSVSGTQNLSATGGGGAPYIWTIISGGGSLSKNITANMENTLYTAPASNPECANNPTIQVKDYCDHIKTLKLAINGYAAHDANAYGAVTCIQEKKCTDGSPAQCATIKGQTNYFCDGVLASGPSSCSSWSTGTGGCNSCSSTVWPCPATSWNVYCPTVAPTCAALGTGTCCAALGTSCDLRTAGMKTAGCCPAGLL